MQTIQIDDADFKAWLAKMPDEVMQAALDGLNRTQEEAMMAGKAEVKRRFIDRTPNFIHTIPTGEPGSPIPRDWRASMKGAKYAVVAIGDGGGKKLGDRRRAILEPFELGKPKRAHTLPVFIPTKALRPNMKASIPKALLPRYLLGQFDQNGAFTGLGRGKGKHTKLGPKRSRSLYSYFLVQGSVNRRADGIYERYGPKPNQTRMIWAMREQVNRPAILHWVETTSTKARERLEVNVAGMVGKALERLAAKGAWISSPLK